MADPPDPQPPLDLRAIGIQLTNGLMTEGAPGLIKAWQTASIETQGRIRALDMNLAVDMAAIAGQKMHDFEEPFLPIMAGFIAPILSGLFGAEFNERDFSRAMAKGAGNRGATEIMNGFMRAIVGDTPAELQPTDTGAKRIAAAAVQASLESTFNAEVPEMLSHLLPFDVGHFEHLSALPENIIRSLGVSRLVRRALQPFVTVCCTTPAVWKVNKDHRPTLLGASTLARQITRNPPKADTWKEDLRREGYTEERIEALLNEQAKFHSIADLDLLMRAGTWSEGQSLKHLSDQGYAADIATTELQIEKLKRIATFERQIANAAVDAYVEGRISEGELGGGVTGSTISPQEKAQYVELAIARRMYARRPLTPAEAKACVHAKILSVRDYRLALERDGRDDEAVAALELLLRSELDKEADVERLREKQAEERARDKEARDAARAARLAAVAAQRALARRGTEADLEAAAIRGLIPIGRVTEVYAARYDSDTVDALVELLTDRRAAYVAQQEAAALAKARAAVRAIDVGAIERAVLEGVLTLDQYRGRLGELGFTPADADLLAATLAARIEARDEAQRQRDAAAAAAKVRHIDLGRLELLVRRGHRSLADYDAQLAALGFEEGARAAMRELLQLQIDDDAAAARTRAAAAAHLAARGLSLEQFRRAVVLGLKPINAFVDWLLAQGFSAADAGTLRAELAVDVAAADAAQRARDAADRRVQAGLAPLADVRRAARLRLIPVSVYEARLVAAGYTPDDLAIEQDLLATEISDDAAQQAAADAREASSTAPGLTLAQLRAAVLAGVATIDAYAGRAAALGFSAADTATLRATLQATLDATAAARARAAQLAAEGADREVSRADVEKAVRAGLQTLADYGAWLDAHGYAQDDAALLVAILAAATGAGNGANDGGGG